MTVVSASHSQFCMRKVGALDAVGKGHVQRRAVGVEEDADRFAAGRTTGEAPRPADGAALVIEVEGDRVGVVVGARPVDPVGSARLKGERCRVLPKRLVGIGKRENVLDEDGLVVVVLRPPHIRSQVTVG